MATLFHFPSFLSLSSRKLLFAPQQEQLKLIWETQEHPTQKRFTVCACSNKKPRGSRKVKSNAELCNDIREFVTAFGLPEDHVPSLKELLLHGRNDLANVVRRRGYKRIRELLANSTKSDIDGLDQKKSFDANQDAVSDHEDVLTGQDNKVNTVVEDISSSTEVLIPGNYSGSSCCDSDLNSAEFRCVSVESSANSFLEEKASCEMKGHNEKVNNVAEDVSLSTEVATMESSSSINPCLNTAGHSCTPVEYLVNSSLAEKDSSKLQVLDEKVNNIVEDMPFSIEGTENYSWSSIPDLSLNNLKSMPTESLAIVSLEQSPPYSLRDQHEKIKNIDQPVNSGDDSCMPTVLSANSSFEEKVAKFIQNGDLDIIDDNAYGLSNESVDEESDEFIQPQNMVLPRGEEHSENVLNGANSATTVNGSTLTSKDVAPAETVRRPLRDDLLSSERLMTTRLDKDLDTESSKREEQAEINHLKFMLLQKELEFSRLKEQIEKEKLALSDLQTKAETEIRNARKLISEKDAELHAAEESLSGLEEVQIQYCGDGEIVEVSGSFDGWHHRIKMDPQSSSAIIGPLGSRKSRIWSTMLLLYPGIYEIKFIVDGRWRIDPQRESVTRGTIRNNIIRVEK
ncbi:protein PTST homolog 3, chloroplastic isoform X2 [Alnus glutinosa]|uniref:protein PTST homolog 3, chloroplastic isoform X2 n=1 Tax=Alnus glutinosa TaxID=3517 RepID=UPI002D770FF5|nr:protein PTST homolog 3, chloroplastic isoform X2 [Alnus glutinosa]